MKYCILIILIPLLLLNSINAQEVVFGGASSKVTEGDVHIDSIAFLLGTLRDYNGRVEATRSTNNFIDQYTDNEQYLLNFIAKFIQDKFTTEIFIRKQKKVTVLESKKVSKLIDNSFDGNSIKENVFANRFSICSYIAGVYLRYGTHLDSKFINIKMANAPRNTIFYELLKQLGCEVIIYKKHDSIPVIHDFIFVPTPELYQYLKYYDDVNQEKKREFEECAKELLDCTNNEFEDYIREHRLRYEEMLKAIQKF